MKRRILVGMLLCLLLFVSPVGAQEDDAPIVQAVLFYSPSCPHCHQVIKNDLPPLQEKYGDQLQILGVDTSQPAGQRLYENMIVHFEVPREKLGVPALLVGDQLMVGSYEIPQRFPDIIEAGMAGGGIGWPEIPDLTVMAPDLPPAAGPPVVPEMPLASDPAAEQPVEGAPSPVPQDPEPESEAAAPVAEAEPGVPSPAIDMAATTGGEAAAASSGVALAWTVMIGMVIALGFVAWRFVVARPYLLERLENPPSLSPWIVPLVLIGVGVAAYLAYVEITQTRAVCGPVGECNIVQASSYARIFGIPIAVLGLLNYLLVGGLWLWQRGNHSSEMMLYSLLGLTVFGTFFSIYLTALELFVIDAVCAWCLTSAVVTTLLMVIVVYGVTKRPSDTGRSLGFAGGKAHA